MSQDIGGASVNAYNPKGETPLLAAIHAKQTAVVAVLLASKADVNLAGAKYPKNPPFLAAAAVGRTDILELLWARDDLQKNAVNAQGYTALHVAAVMGNKEAVVWLVQRGLNLAAQSKQGATPLELARQYNHPAVVAEIEQLIAEFNLDRNALFLLMAALKMDMPITASITAPEKQELATLLSPQRLGNQIANFMGFNLPAIQPGMSATPVIAAPPVVPGDLTLAARALQGAARLAMFSPKPDGKTAKAGQEKPPSQLASSSALAGIESLDHEENTPC